PKCLRLRFNSVTDFNWNRFVKARFFIVFISILTGIFSHILWDEFTHAQGFFVTKIPELNKVVIGLNISLYKILQHTGTLLGFAVIITSISLMPREEGNALSYKTPYYWFWLIIIMLCVLWLRFP